ncbi:hypothetical protein IQ247_10385 [Plectonema cf. radiosum LEGE 06105]|uniref:Uncharacterized protein n=1 Tax=Plectonema cf. radiosum LEGE 06105 TaxID=945769 RepID=A0A8J7JZZ3_9CYAN|nr:hypothetical protein [Plectonema radiosum]MBE9213076.1 hypothetical protein [Plectonema cf. radiosum LEGE 06105]
MLKINFLAALGVVVTLATIANPVNAQSSINSDVQGYTLSGDSLTGINQRTANQDFSMFFNYQPNTATPVNNNVEEDIFSNPDYNTTGEQVQIRNTPVLLQPGQQNINGNDGLQVQFDLTNTNR